MNIVTGKRGFIAALVVAGVCVVPGAAANTAGKMNVEPGVYKLKPGSKLPLKGPVVRVYSEGSNTTYSRVAPPRKSLPVLVKYTASCSNKGRLGGGDIAIGEATASIRGGDRFRSKSVYVKVPYSAVAGINPAQHCNEHAKTLSLQRNKPLDKIVQKGFAVRIPDVLSARGTAYCTAGGLGKGDVASDTTDSLVIFLDCVANPKARGATGSSD